MSNSLFEKLLHKYFNLDRLELDSWSYSGKIQYSFLHSGHAREPEMITKIRSQEKRKPTISEINTANQLEITNCPKKSAYIATPQKIEMELDFLSRNYKNKKFYVGKDLLDEIFEGLAFTMVRNTKIPLYYRILIESGIYGRLMVEKAAVKDKVLRLEGVSSLEGGLVTLFILCGAGISLAGITFCFECRRIIWRSFRNGNKNILIVFKMLRQNLIKSCKRVSNCLKMLTRKRKTVKFRRHRKIHVETIVINVKPK
jgi:hypothetical protein